MAFRPDYTIDQAFVRLSARQPVRWAKVWMRERVRPHDHEFTEICLILKGRGLHVSEDGILPLQPGQILIMPKGSVHAFEKPEEAEAVNIYYLAEWFLPELRLDGAGDGLLPLFFPEALSGRKTGFPIHEFLMEVGALEHIVRELQDLENLAGQDPPSRWISSCFFKVLLLLANGYRRQTTMPLARAIAPVIWRAVAEMDGLVNSGQKLDLAQLARKLGLTRDHLGRLFREEVGETPTSFYQRRRLQFVCRLLLRSDSSLAEIAHRFGYVDEAHMCRVFREHWSMTPGNYRKKFSA
jgi:AraC-like DNA-binding protein